MKPSPLQLNYVVYPKISVEAIPVADDQLDAQFEIDSLIDVEAFVRFEGSADHLAMLTLKSKSEVGRLFDFEVEVFAKFSLNTELARAAYKDRFPVTAAVNVARILFSGARELLATASARSPHGALLLPSVLLEPSDVDIAFDSDPDTLVPALFGISFESLKLNRQDGAQSRSVTPKDEEE